MAWNARRVFATGERRDPEVTRLLRAWRTIDPTLPELSLKESADLNFFFSAMGALAKAIAPAVGGQDWRIAARERQNLPYRFADVLEEDWNGRRRPIQRKRRRGRPKGTGHFRNKGEFVGAVASAARNLREQRLIPTQHWVAWYFTNHSGYPSCSERQLRRWAKEMGHLSWQHLLRTIEGKDSHLLSS